MIVFSMMLKFFGGAREVGRSSIMIRDGRSIMLDFGIKIDGTVEFPVGTPDVDALVLSHAHLDHSGFAPGLYEHRSMPTFGTRPTLELSTLLLEDTLSIARKEHMQAKYSRKQLALYRNNFVALDYLKRAEFGNFNIELYDAGHISGSAITLVERVRAKNNRRIVYTGDFKLSPQILHTGADVVKSDVLITESTYESKEHPDRKLEERRFIDGIREVLDNGGNALVPAFAVGRSQELLTMLHRNGLSDSTFIDGMCRAATKIVARNPKFISNADVLADAISRTSWIEDARSRTHVLDGPSIILTTAGMLSGGPVLNYITKLNSDSRIFITGYQTEGTNGRSLIEDSCIMLHGKRVQIKTPVEIFDFSAHAGNGELYEYIRKSSPNVVVCVHGDENTTTHFAEELRGQGFEAYAPKIGESIEIRD